METKPYYLLSDAVKLQFSEKLEAAFSTWSEEWLNKDADVRIGSIKGNQQYSNIANAFLFLDGVTVSCDDIEGLSVLVLGKGCNMSLLKKSSMFKELIADTSRSLLQQLIQLLVDDEPVKTSSCNIVNLPCVEFEVKVSNVCVNFYFSSQWMQQYFPMQLSLNNTPKLESLGAALKNTKVNVQVHAGQVNLNLREVLALKEGDVLKTTLNAADALPVISKKQTIGAAYLGASNGCKAVVINSHQS